MPIHRYFLTDFVTIQRQSFLELLEKGIIEEFSKRNPITNTKRDLEFIFYPEYYILTRPEYTPQEAILKNKSYISKLFVPGQLTDHKSQKKIMKWFYIGNIPLMTKRGHFILNGAARVIVNQILRSPGVYYQQKIYENYPEKWSQKPDDTYKRFYADLICMRGTWLRIEMDKEKNIWAQMKKGPKIPIYWFLLAMGLSEKKIFKTITDSYKLLGNLKKDELNSSVSAKEQEKKYAFLKNPPEAWQEIYKLLSLHTLKKTKTGSVPLQSKGTMAGSSDRGPGLAFDRQAPEENLDNNRLYGSFERQPQLVEEGRKWLYNKFMNPRSYNLGKQGRLAFNKKLNLNISLNQTTLTALDVLFATDYLIRVEKGQDFFKIDDIDHLKNRRVRTSGELIQIQIAVGLVRLEKSIRENLNKLNLNYAFSLGSESNRTSSLTSPSSVSRSPSFPCEAGERKGDRGPSLERYGMRDFNLVSGERKKDNIFINIVNSKAFNSAIREFFGTSPLSQFMDQINPLAELTHKRRLSSMGPGGVTRDTATLAIRGIHPTHYGRICPIETPEGKNTGLVNSMTTYARVNSNGIIESPYYKVYKGQVQKNTGMYYFSADQEETVKLAAADLSTTSIGFLPKAFIPVRIAEEFTKITRSQVQYVGISPLQMISIATSLIPFLEHDDANRALMGSNMQRQAVPLIKPERPIVGTGLEARTISDSGHAIIAKKGGLVTYVSSKKIVIYSFSSNTLSPSY